MKTQWKKNLQEMKKKKEENRHITKKKNIIIIYMSFAPNFDGVVVIFVMCECVCGLY